MQIEVFLNDCLRPLMTFDAHYYIYYLYYFLCCINNLFYILKQTVQNFSAFFSNFFLNTICKHKNFKITLDSFSWWWRQEIAFRLCCRTLCAKRRWRWRRHNTCIVVIRFEGWRLQASWWWRWWRRLRRIVLLMVYSALR